LSDNSLLEILAALAALLLPLICAWALVAWGARRQDGADHKPPAPPPKTHTKPPPARRRGRRAF
jgi:hypothetical protein